MFSFNRKITHHPVNKKSHKLNLHRQSQGANTDVDFKAAVIEMFSLAIKNMLGTNEKLESLSTELEDKRRTKWSSQN